MYSVKSGYFQAMQLFWQRQGGVGSSSGTPLPSVWSTLWKLVIPPKVKLFLWRFLHSALPTKLGLMQCGMESDLLCPFCGLDEVSENPLFT